ncbi:unnamed protein product [Moneuplotes crassus]|uniref:Uncharacterized protein n=1 Tax=Euplotes crassus TaxID=5936 RepID=A0AAD1UJ35_EUPCR|nr:unnamed protein product [Moneuplotes crassus]
METSPDSVPIPLTTQVQTFKNNAKLVSKALKDFLNYSKNLHKDHSDLEILHKDWLGQLNSLKLKAYNAEEDGDLQQFEDLQEKIDQLRQLMEKERRFGAFMRKVYWEKLEERVVGESGSEEKREMTEERKDSLIHEQAEEIRELKELLKTQRVASQVISKDAEQKVLGKSSQLKSDVEDKKSEVVQGELNTNELLTNKNETDAQINISKEEDKSIEPFSSVRSAISDEAKEEEKEVLIDKKPDIPKKDVNLHLDISEDIEMVKGLTKRFSELGQLKIHHIPARSKEAKELLDKYFPLKVNKFSFNENSALSKIDFYSASLLSNAACVTGSVHLCNFKISQTQMISILPAFKKVNYLALSSCVLAILSVPAFGASMKGCTIRALDLNHSGDKAHGKWSKDNSSFVNLMTGLGKVKSVKENLKMLLMLDCGIDTNVVKRIMTRCGFNLFRVTAD